MAGGDEESLDEYQELNAREEQDIEIMMDGCEYAISNAEAFAEKLSSELQVLDGVSVEYYIELIACLIWSFYLAKKPCRVNGVISYLVSGKL